MFGSRLIGIGAALLILLGGALGAARPSSGAAPEGCTPPPAPERGHLRRYVVEPGDTLWAIASGSYGGDPREGVWRIRERNEIEGALIRPGDVLYIPR